MRLFGKGYKHDRGAEKIIAQRLIRAREALTEAKILMEARHHMGAVNRFYYACFYAASALLETQELSSSKHSGVRSLFNLHFAKSGLVSASLGKFYGDLFDARHVGDYSDFSSFTQEEVEQLHRHAIEFVDVISQLTETLIAKS